MLEQFTAALAERGLHPNAIVPDGKIHRFSTHPTNKRDNAGWYSLTIDGDCAWGGFGCHRQGIKESWHSHSNKRLSAKQRLELDKKSKAAVAKRQREEKAELESAISRAKWIWSNSNATGLSSHPYVVRKKIKPLSAKIYRGFIAVPLYNDGEWAGLQLISPQKNEETGRDKTFIRGTRLFGSYSMLAWPQEDPPTIIICEGWATACTCHEATGLPVVIAFSSSNLVPVSKYIRKLYKNSIVIVAADNDESGIKYAREASLAIGGIVRIAEEGDFNDVAAANGIGAVKDALLPPPEPAPYHEERAPEPDRFPFRMLGYNAGHYYYLPEGAPQVTQLAVQGHTKQALMSLAPLDWWIANFSNNDGGIATDKAVDYIFRGCERAGIFDISLVRGRGAWIDNGKVVLNLGDRVVSEGKDYKPSEFPSKYIYQTAFALNGKIVDPMDTKQANRFHRLCEVLPFESELSAFFLSGWCVCAHIGGALDWRPHLWMLGKKGAGKSWCISNVVKPILGKNRIFVQSASTEAGIRQMLGGDALPVLFDEAEGVNAFDQNRLQKVLELVRQSSSETGGIIAKGTPGGKALQFNIRSCFMFSSINAAVIQPSDKSRVTLLEISEEFRKVSFEDLVAHQAELLTDDYISGFYARAVKLAPIIKDNAKVFAKAAAAVFGEQRAGDQIGTLLAGAFSLFSDKLMTYETAVEWMNKHDWTTQKEEIESQKDEEKLLYYLMQRTTRLKNEEYSIGKLVGIALNQSAEWDKVEDARKNLGQLGIKIDGSRMYISNTNPNLAKILENTAWAVNWSRILRRLPGAQAAGVTYFGFTGSETRAVSIPVDIFMQEERKIAA